MTPEETELRVVKLPDSLWLRGRKPSGLYIDPESDTGARNPHSSGKMCCLGVILHSMGVSKEALAPRGTAREFLEDVEEYKICQDNGIEDDDLKAKYDEFQEFPEEAKEFIKALAETTAPVDQGEDVLEIRYIDSVEDVLTQFNDKYTVEDDEERLRLLNHYFKHVGIEVVLIKGA